jgi:hypothetical protein
MESNGHIFCLLPGLQVCFSSCRNCLQVLSCLLDSFNAFFVLFGYQMIGKVFPINPWSMGWANGALDPFPVLGNIDNCSSNLLVVLTPGYTKWDDIQSGKGFGCGAIIQQGKNIQDDRILNVRPVSCRVVLCRVASSLFCLVIHSFLDASGRHYKTDLSIFPFRLFHFVPSPFNSWCCILISSWLPPTLMMILPKP